MDPLLINGSFPGHNSTLELELNCKGQTQHLVVDTNNSIPYFSSLHSPQVNQMSPPLLPSISPLHLPSESTTDYKDINLYQQLQDKKESSLMSYLQQMCTGMHLKMKTPEAFNPLYKTELCRSFEETGQCRYVGKCQFAHGLQELRMVSRHPKYKTEICKTFHTIGTCPYGTRCRFIHKLFDEETEGTEKKQILNDEEQDFQSTTLSSEAQNFSERNRYEEFHPPLETSCEYLNASTTKTFPSIKDAENYQSYREENKLFGIDRDTKSEALVLTMEIMPPISNGRKRALSTSAISTSEMTYMFGSPTESYVSLVSSPTLDSTVSSRSTAPVHSRRLPVFQHLEEY